MYDSHALDLRWLCSSKLCITVDHLAQIPARTSGFSPAVVWHAIGPLQHIDVHAICFANASTRFAN